MRMRVSCADYTWPSVPHAIALDLIRGLEFDAVDIGFMAGYSHVRPESIGPDLATAAGRVLERCESRGLAIADVFAVGGEGFETIAVNHPDDSVRAVATAFVDQAVEFAHRLGSPGLTVLPGVAFDGEPWERAAGRAATALTSWVERAGEAGLQLSIEPHTESIADTPEKAAALVGLTPGLTLTLDYSHFIFEGATEDDVEPLLPAARHVQCRGGAPGVLQADMRKNQIDYPRMVRRLAELGYDGYLATEYVWTDWHDCDKVDNLASTVALRDVLRGALT